MKTNATAAVTTPDSTYGTPSPRLAATRTMAWVIGAAATLLALWGSWIPSLWGDEAASVLSAERPIPSLLTMLQHVDAVHGTYYLGLHAWVDVFGASPFSVRVPSAVAVGLAGVAVVRLACRLSGTRTALLAGLVYCLLPRVTYMGEEARPYALDAAIAAWLLVLLLWLIAEGSGSRAGWVAYTLLLALSIYLFLYLALFVVVHVIVLASARPTRVVRVRWLVSTAVAFVAASPVIVLAILERQQVAFLASQTTTDFVSLAVGVWFTKWFVAIPAWALIVVAAWNWIGRSRQQQTPRPQEPSGEVVVLAWLLVPGILLVASTLVIADFSGRYLSMSAPAAALCIGIGLDRLAAKRGLFGIVGLVVILAVSVPVYLSQRTPYAKNHSDWAEIAQTVQAHARPGQAVVFDESTRPSRRPRLAYRTYPGGFRGLVDVTLDVPYSSASTWHDVALTVPEALARGRFRGQPIVWLVEYATPGHVDSYGRADLDQHGYVVTQIFRLHRSVILRLDKSPASPR